MRLGLKWIWIGAIGKALNYIFENIAIHIGYSYGNILVQPVQTVVLLLAAALLFKDKITKRSWVAAVLCIIGVIIVGWNGVPLHELLNGGGITTILFILAGIGAAVHVLSQRMLIQTMDNGNMNVSIFIISTCLVTLPIPFQSEGFVGPVTVWAWGALLLLGLITGFSFYGRQKRLNVYHLRLSRLLVTVQYYLRFCGRIFSSTIRSPFMFLQARLCL